MIIWGGTNGSALNSGGRYNPYANSWSSVTTSSAPTARYGHTAVMSLHNGIYRMIVWGGTNGGSELNTGGMYNLGTSGWNSTQTTGAPTARQGHTAVWTGSEMIIWGGTGSNVPLSTGFRFTPPSTATSGGTWTAVTNTSAPTARLSHSAVWTGTEMVIWGGVNGTTEYDDGARYNPTGDAWTSVTTASAPTPRFAHSAIFTGSRMIVWGGNDGAAALGDGATYYIPSSLSNSWSSTTTASAAAARRYHTAVWDGAEMIVYGGSTSISSPNCVNTGARYNPVTNSWRTMANAARGRCEHTAVWTGRRMVVWAGRTSTNTSMDYGEMYNPISNSWVATDEDDAPSARYKHTAVWTGEYMVVWGGINGGTHLSSGGRFDPNSSSDGEWSSLSTTNAPSARQEHTAVWTGSRMIIWGGRNGSTYLQSGASYDPSGNSWTATSTVAAPTVRNMHSAVWTGSQMIVWGGYNGTSRLDTGGLYDPATDTWSATSTTLAPTARSEHTAVWNGTHMIIWGGFTSSFTNSGGIYDAANDTWAPLTTTGAPAGRMQHRAIWTGTRMVIWGGSNNSNVLYNTGGIFVP
jgi:N-acetylneuraminic acid mutarotase